MTPGTVVICGDGRAGTIEIVVGSTVWVLTRNHHIWIGPLNQCREPQSQEDLDACPVDVPRLEQKMKRK